MNFRRTIPFALALPLLFAACRDKHAAAPLAYNVRYVVAQPLAATPQEPGPSFLGVIRGDTETSLSFKVAGQIARIGPDGGSEDWKQGELVAAGAVLGFRVWFDRTLNSNGQLASGILRIEYDREPAAPLQDLQFGARRNLEYYAVLANGILQSLDRV